MRNVELAQAILNCDVDAVESCLESGEVDLHFTYTNKNFLELAIDSVKVIKPPVAKNNDEFVNTPEGAKIDDYAYIVGLLLDAKIDGKEVPIVSYNENVFNKYLRSMMSSEREIIYEKLGVENAGKMLYGDNAKLVQSFQTYVHPWVMSEYIGSRRFNPFDNYDLDKDTGEYKPNGRFSLLYIAASVGAFNELKEIIDRVKDFKPIKVDGQTIHPIDSGYSKLNVSPLLSCFTGYSTAGITKMLPKNYVCAALLAMHGADISVTSNSATGGQTPIALAMGRKMAFSSQEQYEALINLMLGELKTPEEIKKISSNITDDDIKAYNDFKKTPEFEINRDKAINMSSYSYYDDVKDKEVSITALPPLVYAISQVDEKLFSTLLESTDTEVLNKEYLVPTLNISASEIDENLPIDDVNNVTGSVHFNVPSLIAASLDKGQNSFATILMNAGIIKPNKEAIKHLAKLEWMLQKVIDKGGDIDAKPSLQVYDFVTDTVKSVPIGKTAREILGGEVLEEKEVAPAKPQKPARAKP